MKIINPQTSTDMDVASNRLDQLISSLKPGRSWGQDSDAQQAIVNTLAQYLDNRFVLLRNILLEGLNIPIPLVLVGPPGVHVLYPSATRGVFRVKEDSWERLDDRMKVFRAEKPNLVNRAKLMGKIVAAYMRTQLNNPTEVEQVLMFSDPGTHVDAFRPAVRIVLADGVERFIGGLMQSRQTLDNKDIQRIVEGFTRSMDMGNQDELVTDDRDAFSFVDEEVATHTNLHDRIPRGEKFVQTIQKIPFTSRQWMLIGFMILVNILLLIAFIVIVFISV